MPEAESSSRGRARDTRSGCGIWATNADAWARAVREGAIESRRAAAARARGGADFRVASYAEVAADPGRLGRGFGAVACNFSLVEPDLVPLLGALRPLPAPGGALLIQTVRPRSARGDHPYRDGWRTETFAAFGVPFAETLSLLLVAEPTAGVWRSRPPPGPRSRPRGARIARG